MAPCHHPCVIALLLLVSSSAVTGQVFKASASPDTALLDESKATKTALSKVSCMKDTTDVTCSCDIKTTAPKAGPFTVEKSTGTGVTSTVLSYTGAGGLNAAATPTYTLTLSCKDPADATKTVDVKVTVNIQALPYSFTVYPDPVQNPATVSEFSVTAKGLVDVLCVGNTGDALPCTCTASATNPAGAPFNVQQNAGDKFPKLYYTGTGVDSTVTTYVITVTCTDNAKPTSKSATTINVNVAVNKPPYFPQYPSVVTTAVKALGSKIGDTVYTATAVDPENNAITYKLTQKPDTGYFTINPGTGAISLAKDLKTSTNDVYELTVQACDVTKCGKPLRVTVPVKDLNTAPVISNLPATISVPETDSNKVLETLVISDAQGDVVSTKCSTTPLDEAYKFVYETNTQRIKLATAKAGLTLLDYEKGTIQYKVICVASDGFLSSTSTLTINVQNENEPPKFPHTWYTCNLDEGKAGSSTCTLNLGATDEDSGDVITYSLLPANNSHRFHLLANSDQLTLAVDYDVDKGVMPQNSVISVMAKDHLGLSSTTHIGITVNDVNDNACKFGGNSVQSSTVNQGTNPGVLGTFAATDDDLTSPNNKVTYQMVSGDSSYLYLLGDGTVQYRQKIAESEHGKTFYLRVKCMDGGSPTRSSTATYALTYLTTTTTAPTTPAKTPAPTTGSVVTQSSSSGNIFKDAGFVALFAILMLLLALGLLASLSWLFCCGGLRCCGAGLGGGGFQGCQNGECGCGDCFNSRPLTPPRGKVHPRDDYEPQPRASGNYKDFAWSSNDLISDGTFGGGKSSVSTIRALPASNGFY